MKSKNETETQDLKSLTLPQFLKAWLCAKEIEVFIKGESLIEVRVLKPLIVEEKTERSVSA